MTNFLIYEGDDSAEPGRVHQSNKVFETEGYSDLLNERGLRFIALDNEGYLPPHLHMVEKGEAKQRQAMPIVVDRTTIKAGGSESAVFTGIPVGATVIVSLGNLELGRDMVPSGAIDLPIPVPCTYHVKVELWPWLPFEIDVKAE